MIDTVVLMLDQSMFTILNHDKFHPSTRGLYDPTANNVSSGSRQYLPCKQNPTKADLSQGNYKPRLTVTKRFTRFRTYEITLKVEFSIPKMVFGNNFQELRGTEFSEVIGKLQSSLKDMGVHVFDQKLRTAPISSVHYSKNIALTDYTTPYTYIKELTKLNISKKLDTNKTDYRNEGHSFKYRANTFEVIFYDKIRDLQKAKISEKRSEEKDNSIQLSLLDLIEEQKPFEVLRIEVRLNTRQKIRQVFKGLNLNIEPTFANIYSKEVSQSVLLHYLNEIQAAYPSVLTFKANTTTESLKSILRANPNLKPTQALELTCLGQIIEEVGIREYRQLIKQYGDYYWYGQNKRLKQLKTASRSTVFTKLANEIEQFEPLNLVTDHARMLSNDKNEN